MGEHIIAEQNHGAAESGSAHSGMSASADARLGGATPVSSILGEVTDPPRSLYRLERDMMVERALPSGLLVRTVSDRDDAALGELMERAYAGTIDEQLGDNSDGAIEVAAWRDEPALVEASVVIVESDDTVLAASLCSGSWDREVWIAYVITEPPWKGHGLGTVAVAESVRRIRGCSNVEILAAVTDGNTPSERLLTSIGFERVAQH
jgi:GNAT superfamily N-acetyltransferase